MYDVSEKIDESIIFDLSVSVNPLGISDKVQQAIAEVSKNCHSYPDPDCRQLVTVLSEHRDVDPNCILCTSGADDAIYRMIGAVQPKRALIIEPTYEEYESALNAFGIEIVHYTTSPETHFLLNDEVIKHIDSSIDIVFLCNPNNPSGQMVDKYLIEKIASACVENDCYLVIDECFIDFVDFPSERSARSLLTDYQNVIIIEALTKFYALAGLRIGFCLSSNQRLLSKLKQAGQIFSVSIPAQAAGIAAVLDNEYWERSRKYIVQERKWLIEQLAGMGITIWGCSANFLFMPAPCSDFRLKLESVGIRIRDCSRFAGLDKEYCRISVKDHLSNKAFIEAVDRILK